MSLEATWLNQGIWELKRNQLAKQALMFSSNLTKNSCIDSSQLYKSGNCWETLHDRRHKQGNISFIHTNILINTQTDCLGHQGE